MCNFMKKINSEKEYLTLSSLGVYDEPKHQLQNELGPFKVQEMSADPLVLIYYDFASQKETEHIQELGSEDMSRSELGMGKTNIMRTSKQSWLHERIYEFPVVENSYNGMDGNGTFFLSSHIQKQHVPVDFVNKRLIVVDSRTYGMTKRIEAATRLVLDQPFASESYQVVNYGLGGQYAPHIDPHRYYDPESDPVDSSLYFELTGDRFATFMVYLSTVELGGATVFPLLGLKTEVVEGDAVFWINTFSDGRPDDFTLHGGCPVLMGSKWVTNKWISYHDQMFTRPCQLKPSL